MQIVLWDCEEVRRFGGKEGGEEGFGEGEGNDDSVSIEGVETSANLQFCLTDIGDAGLVDGVLSEERREVDGVDPWSTLGLSSVVAE